MWIDRADCKTGQKMKWTTFRLTMIQNPKYIANKILFAFEFLHTIWSIWCGRNSNVKCHLPMIKSYSLELRIKKYTRIEFGWLLVFFSIQTEMSQQTCLLLNSFINLYNISTIYWITGISYVIKYSEFDLYKDPMLCTSNECSVHRIIGKFNIKNLVTLHLLNV